MNKCPSVSTVDVGQQPTASQPLDIAARRSRLATLIGRLLAQAWLHRQSPVSIPKEEDRNVDHPEAD